MQDLRNKIKTMVPQGLKNGIRKVLGLSIPPEDLNHSYHYPENWLSKRKFYGQYGEDIKILPLFSSRKSGYFIEIGAMEGVRFSNTYLFEQLGWKGLCVEPHPYYFELLRKNRPNSSVIQAAVGKEDKEAVDFYLSQRGSLSTLDSSLEKSFQSHYGEWFEGFEKIQVRMTSLNALIEKYSTPTSFDLLSIDAEGGEENILAGFDIKKYLPRVVIIEISIKKEPVYDYMKEYGYIWACSNPSNAIFCLTEEDAEIVRTTSVLGEQNSPKHPMD